MNTQLDERIKLDQAKVVNFQSDNEKNFKNYIKDILFEDFPEFQEALKSFYVNFVTKEDRPGITAAVIPDNKVILINDQIAWCLLNKSNPQAKEIFYEKFKNRIDFSEINDLVSMLIRHELLHVMLDHHSLAMGFYCKKFGYKHALSKNENGDDVCIIDNLSEAEYNTLMDEMSKDCLLYKDYNEGEGATAQNGAGDLHLSYSYILKDLDICEKLGGLVLENTPKWFGYDYGELLNSIKKAEEELKKRLYPIVECKFNTDGTVDIISETPALIETTLEIDPSDVVGIRPITVNKIYNDIEQVNKLKSLSYISMWAASDEKASELYAWLYTAGTSALKQIDCETEIEIYPILKIDNLEHYKAIIDKKEGICVGEEVVVLPDLSGVILKNSIGTSIFNTYDLQDKCYEYRYSALYFFLKKWFKSKFPENNIRM